MQLPRGDWQSGGLDLYIAFGSPGKFVRYVVEELRSDGEKVGTIELATSPMICTSPRFSASSAACASGYSLKTIWSTFGLPFQ